MGRGLLHLYTGSGKGKTTASAGLAVRAVGTGCPVIFSQYLKGGRTGELASFERLGIEVIRSRERFGFTFGMDDATKARCKAEQERVFADVRTATQRIASHAEGVRTGDGTGVAADAAAVAAASVREAAGSEASTAKTGGSKDGPQMLVVLDEVLDAVALGFLTEDELRSFIDEAPESAELVMTGREAPAWLMERADYHSELTKRKHPFDQGISARRSVEF
jgi:cob(I)alamin adenosyltransferase